MDFTLTIIGIICIALCAMPFVLSNRSSKEKENQLLMSLKNLAKLHNCEISQQEICGEYAIGIDESKNSISFVLKENDELKLKFVDLATVRNCEISNISRSTANNGKIIDQLNLVFSLVDQSKPDIVLEFYNTKVSFQLSGELQSLKKWNKLINNLLNSKV